MRSTGCRTDARSRRRLGPAWTERGRPPGRLLHEAHSREAWLRRRARRRPERGDAARHGAHRGEPSPTPPRSSCATSATTASARRRRSRTTARSSASTSSPPFGDMRLDDITVTHVEMFASALAPRAPGRRITGRTRKRKVLERPARASSARAKKVWSLPTNPAADGRATAAAHQRRHRMCSRPRRCGRSSARRASERDTRDLHHGGVHRACDMGELRGAAAGATSTSPAHQ